MAKGQPSASPSRSPKNAPEARLSCVCHLRLRERAAPVLRHRYVNDLLAEMGRTPCETNSQRLFCFHRPGRGFHLLGQVPKSVCEFGLNEGLTANHFNHLKIGRLLTDGVEGGAAERGEGIPDRAENLLEPLEFDPAERLRTRSRSHHLGYTYGAFGRITNVRRGGTSHFTYTCDPDELYLATETQISPR